MPKSQAIKQLAIATAVVLGFLFACIHVLFVDTTKPVLLRDFGQYYQSAFYIRDGQAARLYPEPSAVASDDLTEATRKAKLYHYVPDGILCWWIYPPLLALLFVPFSFLSIQGAIISWQILGILCLACSAWLIRQAHENKFKRTLPGLFFLSFVMISVDHCLAVSQAPLVLGLLPLTLGYCAWQKERPILAGLSWSLFFFKPSYLIIAAPICGATVLSLLIDKIHKRGEISANVRQGLKLTAALSSGTLFFFTLSAALFGIDTCAGWLHAVSLRMEQLYGKEFYYDGPWNFTSIESIVALSKQFRPWNQIVRPVMTAFSVMIVCFQCWYLQKLFRGPLPIATKKEAALFHCLAFLPLNSIYFHNYDMVLYLPLLWIMSRDEAANQRYKRLRLTFIIMLVLLAVHFLNLPNQSFSNNVYLVTQPLLLVSLIIFAIQTVDFQMFGIRDSKIEVVPLVPS